MKIGLCLEYPIAQHGGTEIIVTELIRDLGKRHQILLVSPDNPASLHRSEVADYVHEHISWSAQPMTISRAKELARLIANFKPDLVHFHFGGNYAWKTRAFAKSPVVQVHNLGLPCLSTNHGAFSIFEGYCGEQRSFLTKLALFLPAWTSKQYVLAQLETEVAVSIHDYNALRAWYWPFKAKFRWIYHSRLRGAPPSNDLPRRKVVLCVGTIGPRKGQTFLVDAFCRLTPIFRDWQLVLIGRDGDETMSRRIRDLVSKHRLEKRILLLGSHSDDEVRKWLLESAIFVMPSLYEGLGLSLQEALFYGCACIATRCGGVTDLITDQDNGILVPAGQVEPLSAALDRLMSDEDLQARFRARGPKSVIEKGMTAEKMAGRYDELYRGILEEQP